MGPYELHGFGGAIAVRYASWPQGSPVRVNLPQSEDDDSGVETSHLYARLVRHDPGQHTFEVRLRDGSVRVVPEKCVQRVSAPRASPSAGAPARPPEGFVSSPSRPGARDAPALLV